MTNEVLDARIKTCAAAVSVLVADLAADGPLTPEQAVAMGALLVCSSALEQLSNAADDRDGSLQAQIDQLVREGLLDPSPDEGDA